MTKKEVRKVKPKNQKKYPINRIRTGKGWSIYIHPDLLRDIKEDAKREGKLQYQWFNEAFNVLLVQHAKYESTNKRKVKNLYPWQDTSTAKQYYIHLNPVLKQEIKKIAKNSSFKGINAWINHCLGSYLIDKNT